MTSTNKRRAQFDFELKIHVGNCMEFVSQYVEVSSFYFLHFSLSI